jgi:hypothetical protein
VAIAMLDKIVDDEVGEELLDGEPPVVS